MEALTRSSRSNIIQTLGLHVAFEAGSEDKNRDKKPDKLREMQEFGTSLLGSQVRNVNWDRMSSRRSRRLTSSLAQGVLSVRSDFITYLKALASDLRRLRALRIANIHPQVTRSSYTC